jgi:hypothetical protein
MNEQDYARLLNDVAYTAHMAGRPEIAKSLLERAENFLLTQVTVVVEVK